MKVLSTALLLAMAQGAARRRSYPSGDPRYGPARDNMAGRPARASPYGRQPAPRPTMNGRRLSQEKRARMMANNQRAIKLIVNSVPDQELLSHEHLPAREKEAASNGKSAGQIKQQMLAQINTVLKSEHVNDGSQQSDCLLCQLSDELFDKLVEQFLKDAQKLEESLNTKDGEQALEDALKKLEAAFMKALQDIGDFGERALAAVIELVEKLQKLLEEAEHQKPQPTLPPKPQPKPEPKPEPTPEPTPEPQQPEKPQPQQPVKPDEPEKPQQPRKPETTQNSQPQH